MKLSKVQTRIAQCRSTEVDMPRGRGATYAIVYGALDYMSTYKDSKIIVFGNNLDGFKNRVNELVTQFAGIKLDDVLYDENMFVIKNDVFRSSVCFPHNSQKETISI
jgi:hypothetical protein